MPISTVLSLEARQFVGDKEPKDGDILNFVQAPTTDQRFPTGHTVTVARVKRPPWRRAEFLEVEVEMLAVHEADKATVRIEVEAKAHHDDTKLARLA